MEITSLEIKNYRSFGPEWVRIEYPSKINILIGTNNSGKTNVLSFLTILGKISPHLGTVIHGNTVNLNNALTPEDYFRFENADVELKVNFNLNAVEQTKLYNLIPYTNLHIIFSFTPHAGGTLLKVKETSVSALTDLSALNAFAQSYGRDHGGSWNTYSDLESAKRSADSQINLPAYLSFPEVEMLPEYRKLIDNKDLRTQIHQMIAPTHLTRAKQDPKRRALYNLLAVIFGSECQISIPNIEDEIQIEMNGFQQPLSSVGTGIQEILLIGFYLLSKEKVIFCIDEPETHIHPAAQRKFLSFIAENTEHTYYIATHSNHLLDYQVQGKSIYAIKSHNGVTRIDKINESTEVRHALNDLGIRASEIYQTNGIIWVEGPTDRIYIKKWLELKYPELKEGLAYGFQFYGGKLLSHYGLEDSYFEEYLSLLIVNRNAYVVMDSDMNAAYEESDLRDTKRRIIGECMKNEIGYWVTQGREIENYLTNSILTNVINGEIERNIYSHLSDYFPHAVDKSKVDVARGILPFIDSSSFDNNLDLSTKLAELAARIINWNL